MSLSSVARTLDRVNADMDNYTEFTFTADYGANVTAEEFLRPSLSPKSYPAPAASAPVANQASAPIADNSNSDLLADPGLSPSLKNQISTRNPQSAIRNSALCPQVSKSPSPQVSPSSSIPHSPFRIPPSPRPPG